MEKENNIYYRDNPKLFDELELLFEENKKYYAFLKHSKHYLLEWADKELEEKLKDC